jgi:hypothetical protein
MTSSIGGNDSDDRGDVPQVLVKEKNPISMMDLHRSMAFVSGRGDDDLSRNAF